MIQTGADPMLTHCDSTRVLGKKAIHKREV